MKIRNFVLSCIVSLISISISAQNVGINVSEPTEPLEVGGMIFSSSDGYKFPDSTVQTSASNGIPASSVSDKRGIIIMEIVGIPGPYSWHYYSDVVKVFDFSWGVGRTIDIHPGGSATPPVFNDLSILKEIDMTSIPLVEEFFTGGLIPEVNFYLYQFDTVTSNWDDYYHIRLESVYVSEVNQFTEYAGNNDYRHLETITFVFKKIEFEYDWEVTQQYQYDVTTGN